MGQGTESCGGYEVYYDPYDAMESDGFRVWTTKDGGSIKVSDMTSSHIKNSIRLCRKKSLTSTFTCDSEKWDEWIEVFEDELSERTKITPSSTFSPKTPKTATVKPKNPPRGKTVALTCHCGSEYNARIADLKRGWAKSCSKSCAAIKRDFGRKDPVCAKTGVKLSTLLKKL